MNCWGGCKRRSKARTCPWTLTGGSALGAIRSESILFCDDDIDIAIIGRPNVGKARGALKALEARTTKMPVAEKVYRGTALDTSRRQRPGSTSFCSWSTRH